MGSGKPWKKYPEGSYPQTPREAETQGRADYRAGYTEWWAPNLGPATTNPILMGAWRRGFRQARDEAMQRALGAEILTGSLL